ncbi:uncharacterized protein C19orf44 homolog [Apus apus]|uniref:uncharacterized protein C19orf44 homolog n=1 Tax=Apus apus TaxID=8895 RepID=UPI0021F8E497|nr:uncharacterized protein C19orf44 homolog [Apus apus]
MAAIARAGAGQGRSDVPRGAITAEFSVCPRSRSDRSGAGELEEAARAPSFPSRFLKLRSGQAAASLWCQGAGSAGPAAKSSPGSTSHARSSSALRKVAQLESKIMNRKQQMGLQSTDLGQKVWDEESFSSASSHEHSVRGKKYLKSYGRSRGNVPEEEESIQIPTKNVQVKQQLGLDSDEGEMRELMEGFSSRNENPRIAARDSKGGGKSKTPVSSGISPPSHKEMSPTEALKASSFHSKDSDESIFGGVNSPTPSPASRDLSAQGTVRSQSSASSLKDTVKMTLPKTGYTKQSQISPGSDKSDIKSLDELFLDADDSTTSSSNDFRLNILSLDDLAPETTSEAAELKQEGTDIQITQESNRNAEKDAFLVVEDPISLKMTSAGTGVDDSSEEDIERTGTEAEISEHLSEFSAAFPRHKEDSLDRDEKTVKSEYSDDFERSLSTTDSKAGWKMSEEHSESCTYSEKHPPSAPSLLFTREQHDQVHRVTVKETAVQTVDLPFTYCWSQATAAAVLDPPVGNSYVDPVPVASHVISMDAVEALTAYNPTALVLNSMLKQHLMLTQQFMENIHHLHFSLVESLEKEEFHYHTLEEAKEYIKKHKSPPLTLEQAREKIQKAQEEKLL